MECGVHLKIRGQHVKNPTTGRILLGTNYYAIYESHAKTHKGSYEKHVQARNSATLAAALEGVSKEKERLDSIRETSSHAIEPISVDEVVPSLPPQQPVGKKIVLGPGDVVVFDEDGRVRVGHVFANWMALTNQPMDIFERKSTQEMLESLHVEGAPTDRRTMEGYQENLVDFIRAARAAEIQKQLRFSPKRVGFSSDGMSRKGQSVMGAHLNYVDFATTNDVRFLVGLVNPTNGGKAENLCDDVRGMLRTLGVDPQKDVTSGSTDTCNSAKLLTKIVGQRPFFETLGTPDRQVLVDLLGNGLTLTSTFEEVCRVLEENKDIVAYAKLLDAISVLVTCTAAECLPHRIKLAIDDLLHFPNLTNDSIEFIVGEQLDPKSVSILFFFFFQDFF
jgi:aspartokinase-like uncharacterized kinase